MVYRIEFLFPGLEDFEVQEATSVEVNVIVVVVGVMLGWVLAAAVTVGVAGVDLCLINSLLPG